ncbi:predicted protein [Postia placenta Mad-698-R]|nr:predicted protein [Postia placenta Mad-698-R]
MPFLPRQDHSVPESPQAPPSAAKSTAGVPEIDGSSAGFIALVVALAAIVVFSCIAVFFLLRNNDPTPYERELRRARRRESRHASSAASGFGSPGLRGKIARLFSRRRAEGWVRAADDDSSDWDAADERFEPKELQGTQTAGVPQRVSEGRIPPPERDMSTESVELSVPGAHPDIDVPLSSSPTSIGSTLPHDDEAQIIDCLFYLCAAERIPVGRKRSWNAPEISEIQRTGKKFILV